MNTVWTFFYGSFMNLDVLKQAGYIPEQYEVAKLSGFDIQIWPLATLVRSDQHCVYGIVASGTHEELHRLYSQDWVEKYVPEAVLVETVDGKWRSALCYIAPADEPRLATNDYIDRIVGPAKQYEFPDWYIARFRECHRKCNGTNTSCHENHRGKSKCGVFEFGHEHGFHHFFD